jgi:xanthine dehydrogenase accessory factor
MAFADAVFDGAATVDGIEAVRVDDVQGVDQVLAQRRVIALHIGPLPSLLATVRPDVLVDARMRKRDEPENQRGLAPLVIGLGPNFVAGRNCDLTVETSWAALGAVITEGPALPLAGEPRALGGHGRDRYVYAPIAGVFTTGARIGDSVASGEVVAAIGAHPIAAPLAGVLRGLARSGVPITIGTKILEVDPRGDSAAQVSGLGDRPVRIAEGVLKAIRQWRGRV